MTESPPFSQLVVIGSSAGGIEALSTLVGTIPRDFPAPIVIAQHLDPERETRLGEILTRASTLPVRTLHEYERLEPGVVFVVPANRDVEITDHDIHLREGGTRERGNWHSIPSIDRLFATAAHVFGEQLVGVILTGTGSDGAAGAYEVHQRGGTIVIEDPTTASFPALPRSLAPTTVDFIASIEEIGPLLYTLLSGKGLSTDEADGRELRTLLDRLRESYGVDFRAYKQATIVRRLQRRMSAAGASTIEQYLRYLEEHPEEERALLSAFLIKVTEFFRDADLFEALRAQVLPDIIEVARERGREIRLWSAGCATGEEAYSLAILLADLLGDELEQFHVRVFATDLDGDAIAFARQGLYPVSSVAGVPENILATYFDMVDGSYRIIKRVRGLVVFGEHDLAERAPFPRVDLLLCRNVLIYLTPELQRRILQLFAFSLRDAGYLILGKSETTTSFPDPYTTDDSRLKIYRRRGDRRVMPVSTRRDFAPLLPTRLNSTRSTLYGMSLQPSPASLQRSPASGPRADGIMLDIPVGVVIVDRRYDIQYINDAARSFLGIHTSALGDDLIHLTESRLGLEIRGLIDATFRDVEPQTVVVGAVETGADVVRHLQITCTPSGMSGAGEFVTLSVVDVSLFVRQQQHAEGTLAQAIGDKDHIKERVEHLSGTNRDLLRANQQLGRELTELRSQNEEFQMGNEELQAATEEVETLNEELQSTNEELETLNEELQATVEELNTTNDDLQMRNVEIQHLAVRLEAERARVQLALNSVSEGILLIDRQGNILLTNAAYRRLFPDGEDVIAFQDEDGSPLPPHALPQRRITRGEPFRCTFYLPGPDGARRAFEVIGEPVRGGADTDGGMLVIRELPPSAT